MLLKGCDLCDRAHYSNHALMEMYRMVSDAHRDSPSLSPPGRGSPQSRDVSRQDKEEISNRKHTLIWKSAWAGLGSVHVRAQACCSPVTKWNNDDESAENKRKKLQQEATLGGRRAWKCKRTMRMTRLSLQAILYPCFQSQQPGEHFPEIEASGVTAAVAW